MFYLELFRALNAADVRHVLAGGVALKLDGVERATMDIEVAIAVDDANLHRPPFALHGLLFSSRRRIVDGALPRGRPPG